MELANMGSQMYLACPKMRKTKKQYFLNMPSASEFKRRITLWPTLVKTLQVKTSDEIILAGGKTINILIKHKGGSAGPIEMQTN